MKIFVGIMMFVVMGAVAKAQTPPSPPSPPQAKVVAELFASTEQVVKGSPFSAEAVSESVQVLADGNRIVRSSTSKLYRNGEGRFRREISGGSGGMLGSFYSYGQGISILNPVAGQRYLLDSGAKTARVFELNGGQGFTLVTAAPIAAKALAADKIATELRAASSITVVTGKDGAPTISGTGVGMAYSSKGQPAWETKTEELGERNIEGVSAEGTRSTTTIPAGAIGNERQIEIVYEKWYSKDLQLVVYSKHSDPRSGEQTYRLTNINRTEPDPSLFELPAGYKIVSGGSGGTYTYSAKAIEVEKAARAAQAGSTTTKTKP